MKVVLSTEDLNSYGFWVVTSGIALERFKKNPVVTLNHDSWSMSVGKINDIRIEYGQLVGEVEFDEMDEKGKELKRKYEKGYMNGFSIGIRPLTWSEDTEYIKEGQTRATAVKSELMEIAAATVPSNSNAVRLYDENGTIVNLSANSLGTIIPEIKKENKMKEIALSLGLSADATTEQINAKIAELTAVKETVNPEAKIIVAVGDDKVALTAMFIALGESKGVIVADNKAEFEKLFALDSKLAIKMIDVVASKLNAPVETKQTDVTLSALLAKIGKGDGATTKETTWETLSDEEKVKLREEKPTEYKKLYAAYYGFMPQL
jgi:HK97 family phage prohead protease